MMSSKENFDDLKASFDDDLEQLNQEFDQLLLKNSLWNMHWSRTSCLMSLLRKMSRSTNLPQTVLIWMQQLKTSWNAVRKSVCKNIHCSLSRRFHAGQRLFWLYSLLDSPFCFLP